MQNKARLELADYEAVGILLLEFKAGGCGETFAHHFVLGGQPLLCLFCSCQNCVKVDLEKTSGTSLGNIPGFAAPGRVASPPELEQITQKFTLVSCSQLTVPGLYM